MVTFTVGTSTENDLFFLCGEGMVYDKCWFSFNDLGSALPWASVALCFMSCIFFLEMIVSSLRAFELQ